LKTTFQTCILLVAIFSGLACSPPKKADGPDETASAKTVTAKSALPESEVSPVKPSQVFEQKPASIADRPKQAAEATSSTLVAAVASSADTANSKPDDAEFRVMTWNLEWFFDDDPNDNYSQLAKEQTAPSRAKWDWKRDAVAESIHRANPSIAAFQEIENRRVLWYLSRALSRNHNVGYREICIDGDDVFTEQDVGFIYRTGDDASKRSLLQIEPILSATLGRTAAMRRDDKTAEVSKHLLVDYELSFGETTETVSILTLHLRAREEAVQTRTKQARTVHAWLADKIRSGENIIVLGDINTEEMTTPALPGTDMAAICGFDTPDKDDDLIDLHAQLPAKERQTHLLPGKAFDRILVSPALLEDAPSRIDLSFAKIERPKSLALKGNADVPDEHWNNYWTIDDENRDISDHWPLMATFEFK
jgi:endonuclease/exonuclease/phosphatase family metal-dependent hydrolase